MREYKISKLNSIDFLNALITEFNVDLKLSNQNLNIGTRETVISPIDTIQFIVAGPGTGKTTTMVIRALYLIFVENVVPKSIIMTTFTKKAAEELRSRVQGWGQILQQFFNDLDFNFLFDFNSVEIGTLDSLMGDWLTQAQISQGFTGSILDQYGMTLLMTRLYLSKDEFEREEIATYLRFLQSRDENAVPNSNMFNDNNSVNVKNLLTLEGRLIGDLVNLDVFNNNNYQFQDGHIFTMELICEYWIELRRRGLFSFSTVALYFLFLLNHTVVPESLINSVLSDEDQSLNLELNRIFQNINHLFVDEYQDTNFIQEQVYFNIFQLITNMSRDSSLTVVGDDDQSLYRFRGSTVELFTDFPNRISTYLNIPIQNIISRFLSNNYRSTDNIVRFVNNFVSIFPEYQDLRVAQKPILQTNANRSYNPPILFLAGEDKRDIAIKIVDFVEQLANDGILLNIPDDPYTLNADTLLGDISLLTNSAREISATGTEYLPLYLRQEMENRGYSVFNPGGISVIMIPEVQRLLGFILLILDQNLSILDTMHIPRNVRDHFDIWVDVAINFVNSHNDAYILEYLTRMQNKVKRDGSPWGYQTISISNVFHDILRWFPFFSEDKEGIVYMSGFTGLLSQISIISSFGQTVVWNPTDPTIWERSVKSIIWDFLVPIGSQTFEIDDSLLDTIDSNRLHIRTIHQSKGLEFPIVIVDIGSLVKTNAAFVKMMFYPISGSSDVWLSRKLFPHSAMNIQLRDPIQLSFADVIRKFFVAYSRTESLLILAGTEKVFGQLLDNGQDPNNPIKVIQLGWYNDTSTNQDEDMRSQLFDNINLMEVN